ncbi:MAG: hypothetical protein AAF219_07190 [Myxococcota bacterium]
MTHPLDTTTERTPHALLYVHQAPVSTLGDRGHARAESSPPRAHDRDIFETTRRTHRSHAARSTTAGALAHVTHATAAGPLTAPAIGASSVRLASRDTSDRARAIAGKPAATSNVKQPEASAAAGGFDAGSAVNPQIAYIRAYNYAVRAGLSRDEAEALANEVRDIHREYHGTLFALTLNLGSLLPGASELIDAGTLLDSIRNNEMLGAAFAAAGLLLPFVGSRVLKSAIGNEALEAGGRAALEAPPSSTAASSGVDAASTRVKRATKVSSKTPTPTTKSSPFGPKVADAIPTDGVPKNWGKEQIEDAIADYRASIRSRIAELKAFDAVGGGSATQRLAHTRRITKEQAFLRSLEKALENRK